MKEHEVNQLDNFIGGWYIQEQVCDDLIHYFNSSKNSQPGIIFKDGIQQIDKNYKDSLDLQIDTYGINSQSDNYYDSLQSVLEKYKEKYPFCDRFNTYALISTPNIQKYPKGGGYHNWHTERIGAAFPNVSRHLVYMTYLNDVDDDGETEFYHQKIKVKPKKGLTLIWPADWTFAHRGISSKTQEKYIITGWYNFID
jgi:hypothetical protein